MTFDPSSDLAKGASYTATVNTSATDIAGNSLTGEKRWSFPDKEHGKKPPG
jgi:hypothetical protein